MRAKTARPTGSVGCSCLCLYCCWSFSSAPGDVAEVTMSLWWSEIECEKSRMRIQIEPFPTEALVSKHQVWFPTDFCGICTSPLLDIKKSAGLRHCDHLLYTAYGHSVIPILSLVTFTALLFQARLLIITLLISFNSPKSYCMKLNLQGVSS